MMALEARGGVGCVGCVDGVCTLFLKPKNTRKTTTTLYTGAKSGGSSGLAFALVPPSEPRAKLAVRGTLAERRSLGAIKGQSTKRRIAVVTMDPTTIREISSVDGIFTECLRLPPPASTSVFKANGQYAESLARKGRRGL